MISVIGPGYLTHHTVISHDIINIVSAKRTTTPVPQSPIEQHPLNEIIITYLRSSSPVIRINIPALYASLQILQGLLLLTLAVFIYIFRFILLSGHEKHIDLL